MSDDGGEGFVPDWAHQVLSFWFNDLKPQDWFKPPATLDGDIRKRFSATFEKVAAASDDDLCVSRDAALAAIIVLDQFSRNIFRDQAAAFDHDDKARRLAETVIRRGWDRSMGVDQRAFVSLPFEHSEDLADQERAVALFKDLGDANYLSFAEAHRDVIAQFGRFPHRNAQLGREPTPAEAEFLATKGRGF